ncbi:hypothetical protein L1987_08672 [Smallanthus sonchifolius]|uniref:Uncharacterized protein n=1 Tax=Smallanthus sonchifolius TaxID=185202 RepID=A0ACB9JLC5_9ASTR|nr:hypothetical protein L1987_08672 [Smallanthus sonchifolius]
MPNRGKEISTQHTLQKRKVTSYVLGECSQPHLKLTRIILVLMILETDGSMIVGKVATHNMDDGAPLSEQPEKRLRASFKM